jgi:hypothetical protein
MGVLATSSLALDLNAGSAMSLLLLSVLTMLTQSRMPGLGILAAEHLSVVCVPQDLNHADRSYVRRCRKNRTQTSIVPAHFARTNALQTITLTMLGYAGVL